MRVFEMQNRFNGFLSHIEREYATFFFKNVKEGNKNLKSITSEKLFTRGELYSFGLFSGFAALIFLIIIILANEGERALDSGSNFSIIFPVIRGPILILLYMWFFCGCVYIWNKSNTNYKTTLKFNHHYSSVTELMKRTSIFTFIYMVCFLWYFLISGQFGKIGDGLSFVSEHIPPLFWWIIFLVYLFFPSRKYFNGEGRLYIFRAFRDFFKIASDTRISYFTNNFITFIYPLRDV